MLMDKKLYRKDVEDIVEKGGTDWEKFRGKSIFITGATGLIGSLMVNVFLYADELMKLGIRLHILVRSTEKAGNLFGENTDRLEIHESNVEDFTDCDEKIDYIIHAASMTSSKGFVNSPVETFRTTLAGTINMLELAKKSNAEKFVFLSTMEVYGTPTDDTLIKEDMKVSVKPSDVRNCYPISKIAAENLCCDYASEYNVKTAVIRLTQTFGVGVDYNDGRVFAEFARCVIENRNIVLKTKGETKRSYLYTADAATAILTVLTDDSSNFEIYNAANEATYCSIYEMAEMVAKECGKGRISVEIEENNDLSEFGYAPTLCMNLDTSKLRGLGWNPEFSLKEMYEAMIAEMV